MELWENLESIALGFKPYYAFGEGGAKLVDTFQRVVEGDDGAVAGIFLHVVYNVFSSEKAGVVARYEVPHHDFVFPAEPCILIRSHPSVRRSYVVTVDIGVCLLYIIAILLDGVGEPLYVIKSVIAHLMALSLDTFEELRVFPDIVAYHEKGCLDVMLL